MEGDGRLFWRMGWFYDICNPCHLYAQTLQKQEAQPPKSSPKGGGWVGLGQKVFTPKPLQPISSKALALLAALGWAQHTILLRGRFGKISSSKPNIPVPKSPRPLKNRPTNPNPGPKTLLKNFYLSISIYLSIAYIKDKRDTKPDTPKPINLTAPNPVPFTQKSQNRTAET